MMRLPSRRSEMRSAVFRMERCREIEGPEMGKQAAIWPAESSPFFSSCRIWRRVGSARSCKARETDFICYNIAIWLIFVKPPNLTIRSEQHTSELQSRLHLVCRLLL